MTTITIIDKLMRNSFRLIGLALSAAMFSSVSLSGQKRNVETLDSISAEMKKEYYAKGDSVYRDFILLPLEQQFSPGKVRRCIITADRTPVEWRSPDFNEVYEDYMPLLKAYGRYTLELYDITGRLIEIIEGVHDDTRPVNADMINAVERYFKSFAAGRLMKKGGADIMPYSYYAIYKVSDDNPSIYYLDDRIVEITAVLDTFVKDLKRTKDIPASSEKALAALRDIRHRLSVTSTFQEENGKHSPSIRIKEPVSDNPGRVTLHGR